MFDLIENFLLAETTSIIGSGLYSSVFDSDQMGYVIKQSNTRRVIDDGWLIWAIYCMNYKLKHGKMHQGMLDVQSLVIDYRQNSFYAVIERLDRDGVDKTPNMSGNFNFYKNEYICGMEIGTIHEHVYNCWNEINHLIGIIPEREHVYNCDGSYVFLDAHSANWMYRGDQIVLTDPFTIDENPHVIVKYHEAIEFLSKNNPNIKIIK